MPKDAAKGDCLSSKSTLLLQHDVRWFPRYARQIRSSERLQGPPWSVFLIWYVARCSCSDGIPAGAPQRSMANLLLHAQRGCGYSSDNTREKVFHDTWWRVSVHRMIY